MTTKCDSDCEAISFEEALERTGNGLYNVLLVMTCALILLGIGMDMFGLSLVVAAACDLNLTVAQKGILTSLPFVGILLVSYIWGYVSDTRGRRFTLVVPLLISFLLSCVASLSPHWLFLALVKFLCVCFACAANSVTYTLVGESCIQRVRNRYMLLMTCLILLSPAVAGVVTYPTLQLDFATELSWLGIVYRPWRLLIIVLALPSGIASIAVYFFCESPKFLFNAGRQDEALAVLKRIYAVNHRGSKEAFSNMCDSGSKMDKRHRQTNEAVQSSSQERARCSRRRSRHDGDQVTSIKKDEQSQKKKMTLLKAMYEQSAPLFRPPFLWRSIQLFYIVGVVYITNNSFLVWLPHILNIIRISMESDNYSSGNICQLISTRTVLQEGNLTSTKEIPIQACVSAVEKNVILTLIASQSIFAFFNFIISYLPNRRRVVLIIILCISSISGVCLNLVPEPISSVVFFMAFTCTCLGMGILASYFVDVYPTSYRGMASCLSIMVGRSSTFIGINVVGNLIFSHCQITFYLWSLLVLSSAITAWFLPTDKPLTSNITKTEV